MRGAVVTSLICSTCYISVAISFLPVTDVSAINLSQVMKNVTNIVRLGSLERVRTSILNAKQLRIKIKSVKTISFVICYRYMVFFLSGYPCIIHELEKRIVSDSCLYVDVI